MNLANSISHLSQPIKQTKLMDTFIFPVRLSLLKELDSLFAMFVRELALTTSQENSNFILNDCSGFSVQFRGALKLVYSV